MSKQQKKGRTKDLRLKQSEAENRNKIKEEENKVKDKERMKDEG